MRWSPDGALLASASDDRTLRVWDIPQPPPLPAAAVAAAVSEAHPALLAPRHVLFGHTAHLWDCAWGGGLVVSSAEDCSCRFWDLASGALLATIQVGGAFVCWCGIQYKDLHSTP